MTIFSIMHVVKSGMAQTGQIITGSSGVLCALVFVWGQLLTAER